MLKLVKTNKNVASSIEAYVTCSCSCNCACNCGSICKGDNSQSNVGYVSASNGSSNTGSLSSSGSSNLQRYT